MRCVGPYGIFGFDRRNGSFVCRRLSRSVLAKSSVLKKRPQLRALRPDVPVFAIWLPRQTSGVSSNFSLNLAIMAFCCSGVALLMLFAAERCASSPFCICSMACSWLFFPISSNVSAANSASHGPPKSRQLSHFMKNPIPCQLRNATTSNLYVPSSVSSMSRWPSVLIGKSVTFWPSFKEAANGEGPSCCDRTQRCCKARVDGIDTQARGAAGAGRAGAHCAGGGWRPEEQRDRVEAFDLHAHGRHLAQPLCRARNGRSLRRAAARRTTRDWRRRNREHDPQNVGDPTKGWHTLEPQEHG